jgi:alpha-L-fucosidase
VGQSAGQRVESFAVDAWDGSQWQELASATSIGNQRLLPTRSVTTTRVRLRVTAAPVCPAISEIGLFLQLAE